MPMAAITAAIGRYKPRFHTIAAHGAERVGACEMLEFASAIDALIFHRVAIFRSSASVLLPSRA